MGERRLNIAEQRMGVLTAENRRLQKLIGKLFKAVREDVRVDMQSGMSEAEVEAVQATSVQERRWLGQDLQSPPEHVVECRTPSWGRHDDRCGAAESPMDVQPSPGHMKGSADQQNSNLMLSPDHSVAPATPTSGRGKPPSPF